VNFPGIKQNGKFQCPPAIAEQMRIYWARVPEGTRVIKSMKVPRANKSGEQLGAIWGLMIAQAVKALDDYGYDTSFLYNLPKPTGVGITSDDLCMYLYKACPIWSEGKIITLSKASTSEAAKFFDDARNFIASQWGIHIPEPDPNWKLTKEQ